MIGITGAYMLNQALFTHKHTAGDGSVITHAHPYDRSDSGPYKFHTHSRAESMAFDSAKLLFLIPALLFVVVVLQADSILPVYQHFTAYPFQFSTGKGRAPPKVS